MIFGEIPVAEAEGAILAHSVRHQEGVFKKGRVLSAGDVAALRASGVEKVFAARLEADDVHEDAAAGRLAQALAGGHVTVSEAFTGRANLYAGGAGLVRIDAERVRRINHLHESLTVATVADFSLVEPRQMVATVKVIPFAVPRFTLEAALAIVDEDGPLVSLAPFQSREVGLVVTTLSQTKPSIVSKSIEAIGERLAALGSALKHTEVVAHEIGAVAEAVRRLSAAGASPILLFGASAIVDRGDVIPMGLVNAGGEVTHLGMPVDPGNLMMLGRLRGTPVLGVPSCARSPKLNGFDWVLQRLLAGMNVTAQDIMDMGAGGLLTEIPTRPAPRERRPRDQAAAKERAPSAQAMKAPRVAGLILAAGRSTRMGGDNKLLVEIKGKPMVRHVAEAAKASRLDEVVVVSGHQSEAVRAALAGLDLRFIHNPDYASGLASSLKAGLAAIAPASDGVLVCLGDMPLIAPRHIDRLIAAFNPTEGRAICVATYGGKRGNPVLWAAEFLPAMRALTGDVGAKHLMAEYGEAVCEVAMEDDAVLTDLDTPEAIAALAGRWGSQQRS
ncbi:NTP transferase domain-containing protein [Rhodoligotrophos defluvii]|uniref:NTP transferase domain-containing protein n=1 Tax=Rhodoligotrophos defluvii TaxID=2561934 RepID=UPI0010C98FB0|nr:molybdopterin-binding/glycosyltransferase family 2 protein [Rhodoligotrophos defluvii]